MLSGTGCYTLQTVYQVFEPISDPGLSGFRTDRPRTKRTRTNRPGQIADGQTAPVTNRPRTKCPQNKKCIILD